MLVGPTAAPPRVLTDEVYIPGWTRYPNWRDEIEDGTARSLIGNPYDCPTFASLAFRRDVWNR
jgi:hypothetical protein